MSIKIYYWSIDLLKKRIIKCIIDKRIIKRIIDETYYLKSLECDKKSFNNFDNVVNFLKNIRDDKDNTRRSKKSSIQE